MVKLLENKLFYVINCYFYGNACSDLTERETTYRPNERCCYYFYKTTEGVWGARVCCIDDDD